MVVKANVPMKTRHHSKVEEKPVSAAFEIVAANLAGLMASHKSYNTQAAVGRAAKVDQKTVGRILNRTNEPSLDIIAKIARVFDLELWQMLVPNLEPTNPPMLASQSAALRRLYANLGQTAEAIEGVLRDEGNTRPSELR